MDMGGWDLANGDHGMPPEANGSSSMLFLVFLYCLTPPTQDSVRDGIK